MTEDELIIKNAYEANLKRHNDIEKKQTSCRTKVLFSLPILLIISIYVLPSDISLLSSRLFFIILFSFGAFFVILSFWYEDIIFFERERIMNLSNAYKLEEQYNWLPKLIHDTLIYRKRFDTPAQKAIHYVIIGSLVLIELGVAIFFLANTYIGNYAYLLSLPIVLLIISFWFFLRKISGSFEEIFNK